MNKLVKNKTQHNATHFRNTKARRQTRNRLRRNRKTMVGGGEKLAVATKIAAENKRRFLEVQASLNLPAVSAGSANPPKLTTNLLPNLPPKPPKLTTNLPPNLPPKLTTNPPNPSPKPPKPQTNLSTPQAVELVSEHLAGVGTFIKENAPTQYVIPTSGDIVDVQPITALGKEYEDAIKNNEELTKQIAKCKEQVTTLQESSEKSIKYLTAQLVNVKENDKILQENNKTLISQLEEYTTQTTELTTQLQRSKEQVTTLQAQNAKLTTQLEKSNSQFTTLQEQNQQSNDEYDKLVTGVNETNTQVIEQCNALRTELEKLKDELTMKKEFETDIVFQKQVGSKVLNTKH